MEVDLLATARRMLVPPTIVRETDPPDGSTDHGLLGGNVENVLFTSFTCDREVVGSTPSWGAIKWLSPPSKQ